MRHVSRLWVVLVLALVLGCGGGGGDGTDPGDGSPGGSNPGGSDPAPTGGCTTIGIELVNAVNVYRAENGLPAIPFSPSLCFVANEHVKDLSANAPHGGAGCNLHSWSDQGTWTSCCYTPDHAQASCMWSKPGELTSYPGPGYENAASGVSTADGALALWKTSPAHNEVILNQGIWVSHPWQALGAAIYDGYAVLWFGEQVDPGL